MQSHTLEAQALTTGYDKQVIIKEMNLSIPAGKISVIIGGNGCGKSTLLKTLCQLNKTMGGQVLLDGKSIADFPAKKLARYLGFLPQSPLVPEGITVFDLVSRGRFPYRKFMKGLDKTDYAAIEEAITSMDITDIADKCVDELSGGQRQRVWIALALAQQTDILLLDEPTTYLDIAYQVEILELLRMINQTRGTTIVMVLHDINLASRYADYLFAMSKGALVAQGSPEETISSELLKTVFDLDAKIITDPVSNTPYAIPIGRQQKEKI